MESSSVNLYQAIMQAADHIEKDPSAYRFTVPNTPECGTPGCMLGWIGHFAGVPANSEVLEAVAKGLLGLRAPDHFDCQFYERIEASKHYTSLRDAASIALCMREYAEKYHGHEKVRQRPTSELVADLMARVSGEQTVSIEAQSEELTW